jgi:DNA end-binding protein Ku
VPNEDIIKGYQVDKDRYLEVTKDELENIALESTRTIEGLMGMLLRYPYEVRDAAEYFDGIQDVKITKDMLDLSPSNRGNEGWTLRTGQVPGPLRVSAAGIAREETKGPPIAAAKRRRPATSTI